MGCYRYVTPALKGPWCSTIEDALKAALEAGQAWNEGGEIILFPFASLEERLGCRFPHECRDAPAAQWFASPWASGRPG